MINSLSELSRLVTSGFENWSDYGNVAVKRSGNLLLFNYTAAAQFEGTWNFFEQVSRGLIIHCKTGEIVARPFDKFFNYGERGLFPSGYIVSVTEKIDGSLGILYRDESGYRIATRGSFDSEQALWATEFLNEYYNLDNLPTELTLLFEIIYPENRVVVDYGDREDLVLLAVRNRFTGEYWAFFPNTYELASRKGFSVPQVYTFNSAFDILDSIARLPANQEGYVVEYSDGNRWKFKGQEYLTLHKLIASLSFKHVLSAKMDNTMDHILDAVPDEFLGDVRNWINIIDNHIAQMTDAVEQAFITAPIEDRKSFALYIMKQHKGLAPCLFARLDGHDIVPLLYKKTDWNEVIEHS